MPWPADRLVAQLGRWSAARGPLYLLLADRLRQLIDAGQLPPFAALPPDRVLAGLLAVGRSTVVAAYDHLRQEGKLQRHQGRGTWVAPAVLSGARPGAALSKASANPLFVNYLEPMDGVLSLACTAPSGPPPELAGAYQRALTRLPAVDGGNIGYHPVGIPELREGLAQRYTRRGVPTTPEQILVTTGGQQALALLAQLYLSPGDQVLVQAPTYPGALEVFRSSAAVIRSAETGEWPAALTGPPPRLAYLNPTHHNPTGHTLSALARRRITELAAERGIPLVDDTVLNGLSFGGSEPPDLAAFAAPSQVLTIGSMTKTVWGGLRTGWIRAAEAEIAQLARIKAIHDLGSPVLEQLAAVELLPELEEIAARRGRELKRRHDLTCSLLTTLLPEWEFDAVGGGQCLWVRIPGNASAFAQLALRHGVSLLPGGALDATGGSADRLRIPFTAVPDELHESLHRAATAWAAYRRSGETAPAAVHAMVV